MSADLSLPYLQVSELFDPSALSVKQVGLGLFLGF